MYDDLLWEKILDDMYPTPQCIFKPNPSAIELTKIKPLE
jgi:hypothetical protein